MTVLITHIRYTFNELVEPVHDSNFITGVGDYWNRLLVQDNVP